MPFTALEASNLPLVVADPLEPNLKVCVSANSSMQTITIRCTAPIAQQVVVPVLASTDATIARFERANVAFQIIVGAGKIRPIVTQKKMRAQVVRNLPKMGQTALLLLIEGTSDLLVY